MSRAGAVPRGRAGGVAAGRAGRDCHGRADVRRGAAGLGGRGRTTPRCRWPRTRPWRWRRGRRRRQDVGRLEVRVALLDAGVERPGLHLHLDRRPAVVGLVERDRALHVMEAAVHGREHHVLARELDQGMGRFDGPGGDAGPAFASGSSRPLSSTIYGCSIGRRSGASKDDDPVAGSVDAAVAPPWGNLTGRVEALALDRPVRRHLLPPGRRQGRPGSCPGA
jgi:hypothetical protein